MELEEYVAGILRDIREREMEALREYSLRFDGYSGPFRVTEEEFEEAESLVPDEDRKII